MQIPELTIPEIRERLHELADELGIDELHVLAEATRRRFNGRQVKPHQRTPDAAMCVDIQTYARLHPRATEFEIGQRFNVNQGRVSECLFGKR